MNPDATPEEIVEVARGLTGAQKEVICLSIWLNFSAPRVGIHEGQLTGPEKRVVKKLIEKALVEMVVQDIWLVHYKFTPLGLAVRQHLEAQP